jgi:hypothetical protein
VQEAPSPTSTADVEDVPIFARTVALNKNTGVGIITAWWFCGATLGWQHKLSDSLGVKEY